MRAHNPSLSGVESIEGDQETKAVFTFVLADEHNTQDNLIVFNYCWGLMSSTVYTEAYNEDFL